jgi:hypothetical protein
MKKNRFFVFGLIALILALVLAGCSRADPKTLAKQTYDLTLEVMANPLKAVGGMAKAANIGRKVSKLSPADRQIYNDELARLTGSESGGLGILSGLLDSDSASVNEALSSIMGILNSSSNDNDNGSDANQLNGLLGSDSASFGEALNAIMGAIGKLNLSGNGNDSGSDTKQ